MATSKSRSTKAAAALVAKRGVVIGSAHAKRSAEGGRFPESARKSAQAAVRNALRRHPTPSA